MHAQYELPLFIAFEFSGHGEHLVISLERNVPGEHTEITNFKYLHF